ncbi:hypothetical protein ACJMK2_013075 [Sinanodonta woodiana]|uniref:Uncharacterized protein n=1 Tax=Sinanodonta woodiana TaxID=1069815 RepID=A0ABD3VA70_SINWO
MKSLNHDRCNHSTAVQDPNMEVMNCEKPEGLFSRVCSGRRLFGTISDFMGPHRMPSSLSPSSHKERPLFSFVVNKSTIGIPGRCSSAFGTYWCQGIGVYSVPSQTKCVHIVCPLVWHRRDIKTLCSFVVNKSTIRNPDICSKCIWYLLVSTTHTCMEKLFTYAFLLPAMWLTMGDLRRSCSTEGVPNFLAEKRCRCPLGLLSAQDQHVVLSVETITQSAMSCLGLTPKMPDPVFIRS